ncbi:AMP-binding protein, partial [Staphylococcus aureus]|uniref:AMP-binding protein n=1 Tax=Staphylococcus aureus TaxID=1280 RepID=UPI0038B2F767
MFSDTASRFPERVALSCGDRKMTYRELDEASNQWARVLISEGAGPDSRVAICVERSFESVAAVWAITKTGAAFVPIDPR